MPIVITSYWPPLVAMSVVTRSRSTFSSSVTQFSWMSGFFEVKSSVSFCMRTMSPLLTVAMVIDSGVRGERESAGGAQAQNERFEFHPDSSHGNQVSICLGCEQLFEHVEQVSSRIQCCAAAARRPSSAEVAERACLPEWTHRQKAPESLPACRISREITAPLPARSRAVNKFRGRLRSSHRQALVSAPRISGATPGYLRKTIHAYRFRRRIVRVHPVDTALLPAAH